MGDKKVIWITGASSGIGKALTIKFAESGWIVAASARRENLLNELNELNKNRNMNTVYIYFIHLVFNTTWSIVFFCTT